MTTDEKDLNITFLTEEKTTKYKRIYVSECYKILITLSTCIIAMASIPILIIYKTFDFTNLFDFNNNECAYIKINPSIWLITNIVISSFTFLYGLSTMISFYRKTTNTEKIVHSKKLKLLMCLLNIFQLFWSIFGLSRYHYCDDKSNTISAMGYDSVISIICSSLQLILLNIND